MAPPRAAFLPLLALLALLLAAVRLPRARAAAASPAPARPASPALPAARTPLIMLSTIDGTVSAFDARTGATLFTHRDARPAVDSWAAPGVPDYIPSLDGLLYRIDRATDEAHVVHDKFITSPPAPLSVSAPGHPDAVVLTSEHSSVMYVDLRTGRVVKRFAYADPAPGPRPPPLPLKLDSIIAVSRTFMGVRVLEVGTQRELANASLVHISPAYVANHRCLPRASATTPDTFVAYMTDARDTLYVRSLHTGELLWSKRVSSSVVEAHGLAGVRVVATRRDAELLSAEQPALPNTLDKPPMLPAPGPHSDENASQPGQLHPTPKPVHQRHNSLRPYHVSYIAEHAAASMRIDHRTRASKKAFLQRRPGPETVQPAGDVTFVVTSRDAGLAVLVLIVVGLVGYIVGSRPRADRPAKVSPTRRRVKRRRRTTLPDAEHPPENHNRPQSPDHSDPDKHPDTDTDDTDSGLDDDNLLSRGMMVPADASEKGPQAASDPLLELSTGSSGSMGGAGYLSNRSESGWMSVGCLQVSSKVLGVGSHGTVVYEGKMVPGERKVAVKRLLRQFFESARKEISLLVELDEASPHVVRYFAMEEDSEFIYLALELCAGSLAERVSERLPPVPPATYVGGPPPGHTSRALRQLIQGLADLHRVGVVHRDVKPQNVLITRSATGFGDVKLADVGLALRLAANRSSYTAVTNAGGGVGTTGWRAPEVLSGGRQTKAVDIFAAGCVVCFVLTGGEHAFGNAIFGRDGNIVAGKPSLEPLEALHLPEATDIVIKMIDPVACNRPAAEEALRHPFFWTDAMKLSFLVDISDRLYDLRHESVRYTENLDRYSLARAHCSDWLVRMDMELLMGLGRQYENTASGLLRVIRNKRNHYSELSASLRKRLGPLPEDKNRPDNSPASSDGSVTAENSSDGVANFLTYFTSRVPHLLMCVYQYAIENPALIDQQHFWRYGLKVARSSEHLPLHPLVRKARAGRPEGSIPSGLVEIAEQRDGILADNDRDYTDDLEEDAGPLHNLGEDEVIVTTTSDRKAYHRHELVALQALCEQMHPEVKRRAMLAEVYQPSAYKRYKKRLQTNSFEEADFEPEEPTPEATDPVDMDVPPGFQRVLPKRPSQQGAGVFGPRPTAYPASPSASRPPGFGGIRNVATPAVGNGGGQQGGQQHYRRNGSNNTPAPTVSQWSGEERVVDFGALRNRKP